MNIYTHFRIELLTLNYLFLKPWSQTWRIFSTVADVSFQDSNIILVQSCALYFRRVEKSDKELFTHIKWIHVNLISMYESIIYVQINIFNDMNIGKHVIIVKTDRIIQLIVESIALYKTWTTMLYNLKFLYWTERCCTCYGTVST